MELTDEQTTERGRDLAEMATRVAAADAEIERIKAAAKDQLEEQKGIATGGRIGMRRLSSEILSGEAMMDVECERRVADDFSVVEFVRLDTGEVFETEPATDADRQMELAEAEDQSAEADEPE